MKITIDTKSDSKEEIRRAVELLNNLLGTRSTQPRNLFDDNPSSSVGNPLSMFDNSNSSPPPSNSSSSTPNAFNSMFNNEPESKEELKEDDDDSVPEIEFY